MQSNPDISSAASDDDRIGAETKAMTDALVYECRDDDAVQQLSLRRVGEPIPVEFHTVHYASHPSPIPLPTCERGLSAPHVFNSTVVTGNALDVLAVLPAGLCQTVVTSPPYWSLRDYAIPGQLGLENDPNDYINALVDVFEEVRRVLADDGALWLNIGDSYTSGGRTWRAP